MPHSTALRPAADSMLYAELFYTLLLPAIRIKFKFHFCTLHAVLWSVYKVMEAEERAVKKFSYYQEQQKIFHISESNLFFTLTCFNTHQVEVPFLHFGRNAIECV